MVYFLRELGITAGLMLAVGVTVIALREAARLILHSPLAAPRSRPADKRNYYGPGRP